MGMNDFIIGIRTNGSVGRNDNGAQIETWLSISHKRNYEDQSKINTKGQIIDKEDCKGNL